ncbi:MAG TPA: adenylate kinase [Thermoplasmata archaeon]|jgi:adenylate kinase|nr:adenylate kinase [Thermoplasmata archaeon]
MKLVLLGPPGAGKGTQAVRLADHFGVPHISTGDILRRHVGEKSDLGKKAETYVRAGKLVPDALVIEMVRKRLKQKDARKGFILDGFPRTREQARALDEMVAIDHALLLFLDPEDLIKRSTGRRVCEDCEAVYHLATNPPKTPGFCDQCGGRLIQREDDKEETIRSRIEVYEEQTKPLVNYYKEQGKLVQVYGSGMIDEVFHRTQQALGSGSE